VPDAKLDIVGFGPEEPSLKAMVHELGLQESVCFLGAVPQEGLPDLYRRAALFVAPFIQAQSGDEEGLGLVLVEAIGCGCPILAGKVPALAEVLGDGFEDMAVDPRNVAELAGRIVMVLADPIAAREQASQLRRAIGNRLDWDAVAERYARLLVANG